MSTIWESQDNTIPIWACSYVMGISNHPLQYIGINNIKLSRSKQKICQENCD